jgi:hypothetical protein
VEDLPFSKMANRLTACLELVGSFETSS